VDFAGGITFDKNDICDRIAKHGGSLLHTFDLAAVSLVLFANQVQKTFISSVS